MSTYLLDLGFLHSSAKVGGAAALDADDDVGVAQSSCPLELVDGVVGDAGERGADGRGGSTARNCGLGGGRCDRG